MGANDAVIIPKGRTWIDWECEFTVVVGKTAKRMGFAAKWAPGYLRKRARGLLKSRQGL